MLVNFKNIFKTGRYTGVTPCILMVCCVLFNIHRDKKRN
nr:MAG TPA: Protein of unknown function (DUF2627) [Caudoviricetes sp.]DAU69264.1 MAG TPA: Protein of unknown function (DUF2627) [Bacteriophage sp.]